MPRLTARLLGPPHLECAGVGTVHVSSGKALGLLCYLLVNRQVHSRDRLAGMFWPDVPSRNAQASLRTALYEIRRALGAAAAEVLLVDRTRVGLSPAADVRVDVAAIEAVGAAGGDDAPEILRAAVGAYRGTFLDGLGFGDAYDVDDWLFLERERLANLYASALCRLAEHHGAAGDLEQAVDLARRLLAVDPLREDVHRALMRFLARSGQRAAAMAQYATCAELLRREIGVEPLAATTELFEQIRDNGVLADERPAPGPLARAAARAATALPASEVEAERRGVLVGRAREVAQLEAEWQAGRAGGRLVAIQGEAGVGKTRLVAELACKVQASATVLWGRCHEATVAEPYAPLIEALRSALPQTDWGSLPLAPVWMREIARLVPELQDQLATGAPAPLDGVRDRERLFEGVRAFMAALALSRQVLLVVEDLHWCDETSLCLLGHVTRPPIPAGVVVVVTSRGDELVPERRQLVRALSQAGRRFALEPLTSRDTAELVAALSGQAALPARFGEALHRATGGNAFFLVETLRALIEQRSLDAGVEGWVTAAASAADDYAALPVPESVGLIVKARLDRLGDDARHLLDCAAALRRDFEFDLAATVSRLPATEALDALDELLAAGLLRELPLEPGAVAAGYDFAHALVRDQVYQMLSGARRQYLHRQIAGLLEAAGPVQADRVAYHYLRGGVRDRACQWSLRAGEAALRVHAGEAALVHYRSARELAVVPEEELAALAGLGDAFVGLGRHAEAVRSFGAAVEHATEPETMADLHRRMGRAHERQGAFDRALEAFDRARGALRGQPLSLTSVRTADSLATVFVRLGRHSEAIELCRDALRWLDEHPTTDGGRGAEAWLRNTLGMALMHTGAFHAALQELERSLALKRELRDRLGEATLLNNLGVVHYHRGDDVEARRFYRASLELKTAIGDTYGRAIALTNLGLIETHLGQHDAAGALLDEAERCASDAGAAWLAPEIQRVAAQRHLALGDIVAARSRAEAALQAAEKLGVPAFIGVAHRVLGLVSAVPAGEPDVAAEHFLTSLAVFEMLQNDHELAKTHAAYGEALVGLGRQADAQAHLEAAADVFARSGATGRLERLDPLLGG